MHKIAVGSDHRGRTMRAVIREKLQERGIEVADCGTHEATCDYPDVAGLVCARIVSGACDGGVLICGSGLGMSMAANKVPGIRAALCDSEFLAAMSRRHNNANVLVLGADIIAEAAALRILGAWLEAVFEGGRHACRVEKMERVGS